MSHQQWRGGRQAEAVAAVMWMDAVHLVQCRRTAKTTVYCWSSTGRRLDGSAATYGRVASSENSATNLMTTTGGVWRRVGGHDRASTQHQHHQQQLTDDIHCTRFSTTSCYSQLSGTKSALMQPVGSLRITRWHLYRTTLLQLLVRVEALYCRQSGCHLRVWCQNSLTHQSFSSPVNYSHIILDFHTKNR